MRLQIEITKHNRRKVKEFKLSRVAKVKSLSLRIMMKFLNDSKECVKPSKAISHLWLKKAILNKSDLKDKQNPHCQRKR